tara:strand:- start:314 stop:553 length:240 start_codon:yes stop_codon:yes gene_type:complete
MKAILMMRTLRMLAKDNTLPRNCWSQYYRITDNISCDCVDVCKFNPPNGGIQNEIKKKDVKYDYKNYKNIFDEDEKMCA